MYATINIVRFKKMHKNKYPITQELNIDMEEQRGLAMAELHQAVGLVSLSHVVPHNETRDPLLVTADTLHDTPPSTELTPEDISATEKAAAKEVFADTEPKLYMSMIEDYAGRVGNSMAIRNGGNYVSKLHDPIDRYGVMKEVVYGWSELSELDKVDEIVKGIPVETKLLDSHLKPFITELGGKALYNKALLTELSAQEGRFDISEKKAKESLEVLVDTILDRWNFQEKAPIGDMTYTDRREGEAIVLEYFEDPKVLQEFKTLKPHKEQRKMLTEAVRNRIGSELADWRDKRQEAFEPESDKSLEERAADINAQFVEREEENRQMYPRMRIREAYQLKDPLLGVGTEADYLAALIDNGPQTLKHILDDQPYFKSYRFNGAGYRDREPEEITRVRRIRACVEFSVGRQRQILADMNHRESS